MKRIKNRKADLWRFNVKKRDKFACKKCGEKNKWLLQVHHIKKYHQYVELRERVSNGITLCKECHKNMKGCEELWEPMCRTLICNKKTLRKINTLLRGMKDEEECGEI